MIKSDMAIIISIRADGKTCKQTHKSYTLERNRASASQEKQVSASCGNNLQGDGPIGWIRISTLPFIYVWIARLAPWNGHGCLWETKDSEFF
jgi:hypothetical protein